MSSKDVSASGAARLVALSLANGTASSMVAGIFTNWEHLLVLWFAQRQDVDWVWGKAASGISGASGSFLGTGSWKRV